MKTWNQQVELQERWGHCVPHYPLVNDPHKTHPLYTFFALKDTRRIFISGPLLVYILGAVAALNSCYPSLVKQSALSVSSIGPRDFIEVISSDRVQSNLLIAIGWLIASKFHLLDGKVRLWRVLLWHGKDGTFGFNRIWMANWIKISVFGWKFCHFDGV